MASTTTITSLASRRQKIRPYTPRHNGKVKRHNRILAEERLYVPPTPQSSSAATPSQCGTTATITIDPTPPAATSLPPPVPQYTSPT